MSDVLDATTKPLKLSKNEHVMMHDKIILEGKFDTHIYFSCMSDQLCVIFCKFFCLKQSTLRSIVMYLIVKRVFQHKEVRYMIPTSLISTRDR